MGPEEGEGEQIVMLGKQRGNSGPQNLKDAHVDRRESEGPLGSLSVE